MTLDIDPIENTDFEAIHRLVEQPGVSHFLVDAPSLGRERLTLWFERSAKAFAKGHTGLFAIRNGDEVVGFAGLLVLDAGRPEDEYLIYVVDQAHRGQGIATHAARFVVDFTRTTPTRRIVATVDPENASSVRVLEKIGFHDAGLAAGERGDLRVFVLTIGR